MPHRPAIALDAGALLSAEKRAKAIWSLKAEAHSGAQRLIIVSPVITQVWRDGAKQAMLARFLRGCTIVEPSKSTAQAAGVLLGASGTSDAVDALVVATAIEYSASAIVTSDPGDIARLCDASGARVRPLVEPV